MKGKKKVFNDIFIYIFYSIVCIKSKIYCIEEQVQQQKSVRERKSSGKKTRWGSDEDRVPYEQIMLLQSSANELGLQLPNAALGLATQQHLQKPLIPQSMPNMDFYTEANNLELNKINLNKARDREDFTKDVEEDEILEQV